MNVALLYLDILSFLMVILLSRVFLGCLRNPVFLICAWWSTSLFLSNIVVWGEGVHLRTHLVLLLFIYSILGFGIIFQLFIRPARFPIPTFLRRHKAAALGAATLLYLLSIRLGIVGRDLQRVYGPEFRALSFSAGDYSSLLYGSYYLQTAAGVVLSPFVLFGMIALPVAGVFYNSYKWLLLGLVLAIAVAFQGSGRFSLYYFGLATALSVIFAHTRKRMSLIRLFPLVVAGVLVVADITRQRLASDELSSDVVETTINQAVTYHVCGVYLFDRDFSNDASMLYRGSSFGRLSLLAYPDKVVGMLVRRFGVSWSATIDEVGEYWQKTAWLGYDKRGSPVEPNAFYTSVYAIFYDFGYGGIVLVPGLFVYFLVLHFKTHRRRQNFTSLFVVVFLSIFFMTSIFDSKITASDFSAVFYCVLLLPGLKHGKAVAGSHVLVHRDSV
jgi:oligosaccharide repeat unit polymerase